MILEFQGSTWQGNWHLGIESLEYATKSTHAVEITNNLLNRHNSLPTKTSSTKSKWKRKITWVHYCNINLHSQTFSQLEKPLYTLQMYKIKSLKNCCYISSIFLLGLFAPKKHNDWTLGRPTPLLTRLLVVTCFHNNLFNINLYFPLNNQPKMCKINMSFHGCDPINLVIFY